MLGCVKNKDDKVVKKPRTINFALNIIIIIGLCLLVNEIFNLWKTYRNRDCLATVYQEEVLKAITYPITEEEAIARALFPARILSSKKINEKENICEVMLYHNEHEIIVRYRPKKNSSTFSAGRIYDTTVYYGIEILSLDVN